MNTEKPWWLPTETNTEWIDRIRKDYPDSAGPLSDEAVRAIYAEGRKYAVTWDHFGDAYDEYEQLADAYLTLLNNIDDCGRDTPL